MYDELIQNKISFSKLKLKLINYLIENNVLNQNDIFNPNQDVNVILEKLLNPISSIKQSILGLSYKKSYTCLQCNQSIKIIEEFNLFRDIFHMEGILPNNN